MAQVRLLIGISVFWLSLSLLGDGLNTLVLGTGGALAAAGALGPLIDLAGRDSLGYPFLFMASASCMLAAALTLRGLSARVRMTLEVERSKHVGRRAS